MSEPSLCLDAFTPLPSRAIPDRVSSHFTDDTASRASTRINRDMDEKRSTFATRFCRRPCSRRSSVLPTQSAV